MARREQGDDRLTQIIGNAGDDPDYYEDSGKMRISVGVTVKYSNDDDDGETRWVSLWVKNEELQEFADAQISKGTKVVAIGFMNKGEYKGKPQYNLNVTELGVAEMAKKGKGGKSRRRASQSEEPAESEELGW